MTRAWSAQGIGPGDVIAMLCRDHRGLVTVLAAANKVGAQLLLMNTGFAKPQLADVATREKVSVLVYDEEFTGLVDGMDEGVIRFVAEGSLEELIRTASTAPVWRSTSRSASIRAGGRPRWPRWERRRSRAVASPPLESVTTVPKEGSS